MRIYFKNGGKSYNLNYKEKRIVEKLQPIIDAKIAENPELAEKFVPARNFEELEKMYNDYASEEVTIESETINQYNMTEEEELEYVRNKYGGDLQWEAEGDEPNK